MVAITKQNVGVGTLRKLAERGERAMTTLKNVRKQGEHVVEKVMRTAETSVTGFGLGLLNGYHGPVTVAKIPLELLLAGGLELAGYLGLGGKHSDHLNNIGDGALTTFGVIKGVQIGTEIKAKHLASGGQPTAASGSRMSDAEIRAQIEAAAAANGAR